MTATFPPYRDLPRIAELKARHAWGVFGAHDTLGRINLMDEDCAVRGSREVRRGSVFNLCLPLDLPNPPLNSWRRQYVHHVEQHTRNGQEDYLDQFFLQGSSQWDGLRHVRAREFGFYGGRTESGSDVHLGIEKWARHGLIGRGVLLDVERCLRDAGRPLHPRVGTPVTVADLQMTLTAQSVAIERGDVLLLRTGFTDAYLRADPAERQAYALDTSSPGLQASEEMAEFLWDSGVAAVVADNPSVEVMPGDPAVGYLHRRLIPLLGFALGELFHLGPLAADCAGDGRYAFMFVGCPLNVTGGVGSPANAVAVK